MEIHATMIVPASKVAEARAIAGGFTTGLSASGPARLQVRLQAQAARLQAESCMLAGPATHYVSSGLVSADIAEAVKPLCSTYAEGADGLQVIADAGLALCDTSD